MVAVALPTRVTAQTQVLESSALRLEINTAAYSYRLIDKSTGATLLDQSQTSFNISGTERAVLSASLNSSTASSLALSLNLAGGTTANALFSFNRPNALEVELSRPAAGKTQESFIDRGEHYYGLLEYPFAGAIDNRGLSHEMIGVGKLPNTDFANAPRRSMLPTRATASTRKRRPSAGTRSPSAGKRKFSLTNRR